MDKKYWIIKNSVNTMKYVENGLAAVGWSETVFNNRDIEGTINKVSEDYKLAYDRSAGRVKGTIRRFLSVSQGDIIIVPCYKGFYMGSSTGEFVHYDSGEYYSDDRANAIKVDFIKDDEGKPVYYQRQGKNTALTTKIGSRHLVLEVYEEKLKQEIEILLNEKKDVSIENRISNLENKEKDALKKKIKEELGDYSKIWLDAKGAGFEYLVSNLFEVEGYETRILSKRIGGPKEADADILAIKTSKLSPKFNEVIYIQAKHHTGTTGLWGLEQIKSFKNLVEKEDNEVKDVDGNPVEIETDNIKYVLVSSAKIDPKAYEGREEKGVNNDGIILIDGSDLSEMIMENIDEIDISLRYKLGLIKQYTHIDEFSSNEQR